MGLSKKKRTPICMFHKCLKVLNTCTCTERMYTAYLFIVTFLEAVYLFFALRFTKKISFVGVVPYSFLTSFTGNWQCSMIYSFSSTIYFNLKAILYMYMYCGGAFYYKKVINISSLSGSKLLNIGL